jgi:hypothetical protein
MKRILVFSLLTASLLAGCGTSPFAPQTTTGLKASASAVETSSQVQIYKAFKRVESPNTMRLVVMYWVNRENAPREFRQLVLDGVATQDRVVYRSGYRPTQMVLNGYDVLQDEASLLKVARELGSLNYHSTSKEEQQVVALAYDFLMDQVH